MGQADCHPSGYHQSDNTHRSVGGNAHPTETFFDAVTSCSRDHNDLCRADIPTDLKPSISYHDSTSTRVGEYGGTQWVIGDPTAEHSSFADSSRLLSGLGYVRSYSAEQCIPQQAHYQMLNGVNFQKGCYTGQEVIARLEHLGQSKKHLRIYQSPEQLDVQTLELEGFQLSVFDAVTTINGSTALVLGPVDLSSEQLISVPFKVSRQVEGSVQSSSD